MATETMMAMVSMVTIALVAVMLSMVLDFFFLRAMLMMMVGGRRW